MAELGFALMVGALTLLLAALMYALLREIAMGPIVRRREDDS